MLRAAADAERWANLEVAIMKWLILLTIIALGCVAQCPSECTGDEILWSACTPQCGPVGGFLEQCWGPDVQHFYTQRVGASTWGPLEYAGPVRIEMQLFAQEPPWVTLPLEFDVLSGSDCGAAAGHLVWSSVGTSSCDPAWVSSPPLDLGLSGGATYYLRTRAVFDAAHRSASPAQGCLRVVPSPTSTERVRWGRIKRLYE